MSDDQLATDVEEPPPPPRSRVASYYVILLLATAAVVAAVIAAGSGKHGSPTLAGGYDVSAGTACLGAKANLAQSGEFVTLSNTQGTLSGDLTLKHSRLTGTVKCALMPQRRSRRASPTGSLRGRSVASP